MLLALKHVITNPHLFAAAIVTALGWDKVVLVSLLIVGMVVLTATGKIDGAAAIGFFTAVTAFLLGRGSTVNPPPNGGP